MFSIIQKLKLVSFTVVLLMMFVAPFGLTQNAYAATDSVPQSCSNTAQCSDCSSLNSCTIITQYIDPFIKFLTALVGIGVVTSIVIGGIQYSSSGGDPSKVSAAKNRIRDAIVALVTFLLLALLLNFLIPGGLSFT